MGRKTSLDGGFAHQGLSSTFVSILYLVTGIYLAAARIGGHPSWEDKTLKANPQSNPSRFTGEEAQRTLDEIRMSYGIHQSDPQAHLRVNRSSSASEKTAKQQPRLGVRLMPPIPKTSLAPLEPTRLDPLVHGVKSRHLEIGEARRPSVPASRSPSDDHSFHYLIRIAECALPLHCEVKADSEAAARHQVKQIPNLMEWREISGEELTEILKDERALSRVG